MDKLTRHLVPTAVLAVLAVIGLTMGSSTAVAQNPRPGSAPVSIVSPLPLPVSGSIDIAPGSSMIISNSAANPVLVRDAADATFEPKSVRLYLSAGEEVGLSAGRSAANGSGSINLYFGGYVVDVQR